MNLTLEEAMRADDEAAKSWTNFTKALGLNLTAEDASAAEVMAADAQNIELERRFNEAHERGVTA